MTNRVGLLADVHGNVNSLKAVVEDSIQEGVTENYKDEVIHYFEKSYWR